MNNDDIKLTFAKDEIKEDYKLGKILATSAIVSDAPLGPLKPKRTKLKLFILALILVYLGFAVYSNQADATEAAPDLLSYADEV
jgi:hypothetical protein